jgi:hypothetical protein
LFTTTASMPMLRRMAWTRWLPPIAMASPSPMTVMTVMSGWASLMPVANAVARPWVVWRVFMST